MCASPLSFLRAGPPPPKVALLPDAMFFTRVVPITAGATEAEAMSQVELALEPTSPFPLAQLYYGWFWTAGAERALIFAAYRRRFTTDQTGTWEGAELVLPSFATVLGADVKPATTVVLATPEGLTAVNWDSAGVPAKVLFRPVSAEATEEERAAARDALLHRIGGSRTIVDLPGPPPAEAARSDREVIFRSDDFVSRLPTAVAGAMDVRDKGELAALRAARKRDVIFWRVAMGCAAALLLLGLGELALVGGRAWQKVRIAKLEGQRPRVEKIMNAQALANRIEELATKRLLPLEMIAKIAEKKPAEILFNTATTQPSSGIYTLFVNATTTNIGQVDVWKNALAQIPECENVDVRELRPRGEGATFQLVVRFKPEALTPQPLPDAQGAKVAANAQPAGAAPAPAK